MVSNCLFDDVDFFTNVKPVSPIHEDGNGYFIDLRVKETDVVKMLKFGVIPQYTDNEYFTIRVRITNNTQVSIDGQRIYDYSDTRLQKLKPVHRSIREIILKKYSRKTQSSCNCYATRLLFRFKGVTE